MHQNFLKQVDRLCAADYPVTLQRSVAERIIKSLGAHKELGPQTTGDKKKVAVLPYVHSVSHNLKKIAQKAGAKVVFTDPRKLNSLCKLTKPYASFKRKCGIKHQTRYIDCKEGFVYCFPLS